MEPRVSALLLAAGTSKRIGQPKQLLPLNGKPLIVHGLEALLSSGLREVVVVLGLESEEVALIITETATRADARISVRTVINDVPDSDMAASVRKGVSTVEDDVTGVLVFPADHPLVTAGTVRLIVAAHRSAPGSIIVPVSRGRKGHPTLFPAALLRRSWPEGMTLGDLVRQGGDSVTLLSVDDDGVAADVDTLEDYRRILDMVHGDRQ